MDWMPLTSYQDQHIALGTLSNLLKKGSLSLFLGAGVSMSTGQFPDWAGLVRFCLQAKGISKDIQDDEPIDNLLESMDSVRRECASPEEYKQLVHSFLSGKFEQNYSHAQNLLLIAIGALVMSSRRGSIEDIITYNFDDLLEWYFDLHGHKTQVITELPYMHEDSDVRIYHPHGFLPANTKYRNSSHFIFDQFSYDMTVGNDKSPWFPIVQQILFRKVAIMVGLSGKDPAIRALVAQTFEKLKENHNTRPVAFLLIRNKSLGDPAYFIERGIVPLGFETHEDIWKFLLNICQKATLNSGSPSL